MYAAVCPSGRCKNYSVKMRLVVLMRVHIATIAIVTPLDCARKPHFESQAKKDSKNRLVYGTP